MCTFPDQAVFVKGHYLEFDFISCPTEHIAAAFNQSMKGCGPQVRNFHFCPHCGMSVFEEGGNRKVAGFFP